MGKTGALTSKMSDGKRRNVIRKREKNRVGVSFRILCLDHNYQKERERRKHFLEKKNISKSIFPPHLQAR